MNGSAAFPGERGPKTGPLSPFFFFGAIHLALVMATLVLGPARPCRADQPLAGSPERLPPPANVEEARARLQFLADEAGKVEAWVDANWGKAFGAAHPGLSLAPQGAEESAEAYGERSMRARQAASETRAVLKEERKAWLERERRALLDTTIREEFPVRLGTFDPDRGEYPLLLGYGWPTALSIRFRVRSEDQGAAFQARFPKTLSAGFRINLKGEVLMQSLEKGRIAEDAIVLVAPPAPRLLWQGAHESWVTAVAFRPDGGQVVSAGADGAMSWWDTETGNRALRLKDIEMALSLAFSPDGSTLATGGADCQLRLRDASKGTELWRSTASGMIFSVAFSPDGRFIATGDDKGALRLWSAASGREVIQVFLGLPVRAVAFSPEGMTIAAGTEANAVVLWDMASNRKLWDHETDGPVYAVSVGGKGGFVAAGGGGTRLVALHAADGSEAWSRKVDGEVRAVQFDRTGRLLAAGGAGYTGRVYLAETGDPLWSATVGSPVRSLAFGPAGLKLAIGSADSNVRLFDVDEGDRLLAAFSIYGRIYIEREKALRLLQ